MTRESRSGVVLAMACALPGFALLAACGTDDNAEARDRVEVAVKALELKGVGDISYALAVTTPTGTVWSRTGLRASTYGNGQSMTYIGPCDASSAQNMVTLTIEALYDTSNVEIPRSTWVDPGAVSRPFACTANADTRVELNLVILRSANQGFFDIAVNFQDVFCSAKLDCKRESANGNVPLELLHDPRTGLRAPSSVLAFACTAGPGADTHLYMQRVTLVCGEDRIELPVGGAPGNVYSSDEPAPPPLVQFATYRGLEQLVDPTTGEDLAKRYWNLAFAIDPDAVNRDCRLETALTVSDGPMDACTTPAFTTWPVIVIDTPFVSDTTNDFACVRHPIGAAPGEPVRVTYTAIENPMSFVWEASAEEGVLAVRPCEALPPGDGTVDVSVFTDTDGDGVRDPSEPARTGVSLDFVGPDGESLSVTSTSTSVPVTLTPGSWTFSLTNLGDHETVTTSMSLEVTATTTTLVVGVAPAPRVAVVVVREDDATPVEGVDLQVDFDGNSTTGTTGPDGRFETELPVGANWSVSVNAVPYGYNPDLTPEGASSGTTSPASRATVGFRAVPMPIVSVLLYSDDDASGTRGAGEPSISDWYFALVDETTWSYTWVTSDTNGLVVTEPGELAPNTSYLVAWDANGSYPYDPSVTPTGLTVTTGPTGLQSVSLGLVPLPRVTVVQFVDLDGNGFFDPSDEEGVSGLELSLMDSGGGSWYAGPSQSTSPWEPYAGSATLSWDLDAEFGAVVGVSLGGLYTPNPAPSAGSSLELTIPPAYNDILALALTRRPVITGTLVEDSFPVGTVSVSDPVVPFAEVCLADQDTLMTLACTTTNESGRFDFASVDRELLCAGCTYALIVQNPPNPELFDLGHFVRPTVTLAPNGRYDVLLGLPVMPTVSGLTFHDANGDGVSNAGDVVIDVSRVVFEGGPTLPTANGLYSTRILPGTYTVTAEDDTDEFGMPASVTVEVRPGESVTLDIPMRRFPVARVVFAVDTNRNGAWDEIHDALVQTSVWFKVDNDPTSVGYDLGTPTEFVRPIGPIAFGLHFGGISLGRPLYWELYPIMNSGEGDMVLITGPGLADHGVQYDLDWDESPLFVFLVHPLPVLSVSAFGDSNGNGVKDAGESQIGARVYGLGNNDSSFTETFSPGQPIVITTMPSGNASFGATPLGEDWAEGSDLSLVIEPGEVRTVEIPATPMPVVRGTVTNPDGPLPSGLVVEVLIEGNPERSVPVQPDGSFSVIVPNGTLGLSVDSSADIQVRVQPSSIPPGFYGTLEGGVTRNVTPGQEYIVDFTLDPIPDVPSQGTLVVTMFHDQNSDGIRQPSEPLVSELTIDVEEDDGVPTTQVTPAQITEGTFTLTLDAGAYALTVVSESLTPFDFSPIQVQVVSGETTQLLIPLGAYPVLSIATSDAALQTQLPGVSVNVKLPGETPIEGVTDDNGSLALSLGPSGLGGDVEVSVVAPTGYTTLSQTTQTLQNLELNGVYNVEFWFEPLPPQPVRLEVAVFGDRNNDSNYDAADEPLDQVSVWVYDVNGNEVNSGATSNGSVTFELDGNTVGPLQVWADGNQAYRSQVLESINIAPGTTTPVTLLLMPEPFTISACYFYDIDGDSDRDDQRPGNGPFFTNQPLTLYRISDGEELVVQAGGDGNCIWVSSDGYTEFEGFVPGEYGLVMPPLYAPNWTDTHQVPAPTQRTLTLMWGENHDFGDYFLVPNATGDVRAEVTFLDVRERPLVSRPQGVSIRIDSIEPGVMTTGALEVDSATGFTAIVPVVLQAPNSGYEANVETSGWVVVDKPVAFPSVAVTTNVSLVLKPDVRGLFGSVYVDDNDNGQYDATEELLDGVVVSMRTWTNGELSWSSDEIGTRVTDCASPYCDFGFDFQESPPLNHQYWFGLDPDQPALAGYEVITPPEAIWLPTYQPVFRDFGVRPAQLPVCGDGILEGSEVCDDSADPDCVSCACEPGSVAEYPEGAGQGCFKEAEIDGFVFVDVDGDGSATTGEYLTFVSLEAFDQHGNSISFPGVTGEIPNIRIPWGQDGFDYTGLIGVRFSGNAWDGVVYVDLSEGDSVFVTLLGNVPCPAGQYRPGSNQACRSLCGNGQLDGGETCEPTMGATTGCSQCQCTSGYEPDPSAPGRCRATCGNGTFESGQEQCDPGIDSQRCTASCTCAVDTVPNDQGGCTGEPPTVLRGTMYGAASSVYELHGLFPPVEAMTLLPNRDYSVYCLDKGAPAFPGWGEQPGSYGRLIATGRTSGSGDLYQALGASATADCADSNTSPLSCAEFGPGCLLALWICLDPGCLPGPSLGNGALLWANSGVQFRGTDLEITPGYFVLP